MTALSFAACQNKNAYTIVGTIEAAGEGDSISLQLVEGRKHVDLQKAPIVNGKFEFKGIADSVQIAAITMNNAYCEFFLEPGEMKVDFKLGQMTTLALGTPNNNAYEAFVSDMNAIEDEYAEIAKSAQSSDLSDAKPLKISGSIENLAGYMKLCAKAHLDYTAKCAFCLLKTHFFTSEYIKKVDKYKILC